ncbi:lysophospholipid acyltransferase [Achlya hypogyna]|uniref:Lysophospholipid acyltransferase n=1 Tax=Achlya hypogyna TaxID=1202772 RepID=A0A1V9YKR6_ACHHY|nr:lysophospholipid acyltransferase [Achlya hypogyna]
MSLEAVATTLDAYALALCPFSFELLHSHVASLSKVLGFAPDQLRYTLSLFAAYPLALVFRALPPAGKHWFSFITGVLMAQFVLGSQWIHSFLAATTTYALVKFAPPTAAPALVFVFNMAYLSASHLYRIYVDYLGWSLDFTGPQMLLVIKLTSFAYNVYDGAVTDTKQSDRVLKVREALAVKALPSLVEFYGFAFCFATFLAGPAFEYRSYADAISGATLKLAHKASALTSCFAAGASKLLIGVACMAAIAKFGATFTLGGAFDDASSSLAYRVFAIYVALLLTRCKYYAAWKVAEGATVLCGFGCEGIDANGRVLGWNAVSNVDILGFEGGQSIRDLSRAWNKGTQSWLERYVYSRSGNSLAATYFVSAFWHGFYPGYYLFFLTVPLPTAVNRVARAKLRPYFVGNAVAKAVYDVLGWLATTVVINYLAVAFVSLSWSASISRWSQVFFAGHVGLLVAYGLLSLLPKPVKQI